MRNLKRALSLVLAVVMVIGLMVVGASAVSYNDLTDKDEIVRWVLCAHRERGPRADGEDDLRHHEQGRGQQRPV